MRHVFATHPGRCDACTHLAMMHVGPTGSCSFSISCRGRHCYARLHSAAPHATSHSHYCPCIRDARVAITPPELR